MLLPLHPRTRKVVDDCGLRFGAGLVVTPPLGYLEMLALQALASVVMTDSGGVQKEACIQGVPCVTLRDETEWHETVEKGLNALAGTEPSVIVSAVEKAESARPPATHGLFGDGHAAERIVAAIVEHGRARHR